jgi:hypothetical protein
MNDESRHFQTVTTRQAITEEQVKTLLCDALEGGSNYWISKVTPSLADGVSLREFGEGGSRQGPVYWHWCQLVPLADGCALSITDAIDWGTHILDRTSIARGLESMSVDYQRHWRDFLNENSDGITGDVFLQCALFGEVRYA